MMRIRWTIAALAGLLMGLGQADPASAQSRQGTPMQASSEPMVLSKGWMFRPDLTCEVRAWSNEAKTMPLSDGGHFNTHFVPGQAWIELRAKNVGAAMDSSVPAWLIVNSGGSAQTYYWSVSNLAGGSTVVFPTVEVQIDFSGPLSLTTIWALGKTDPTSQLNERMEGNNTCKISFTYSNKP